MATASLKKRKNIFKIVNNKISGFFSKALSTNKGALLLLAGILVSVMTIYFICIYFIRDNFYNNWSDDSLQYYPFMCDFIDSIKSGSFSLYSFKNYLGASFYSDAYYIPLDIFTLLILNLSFFMNTEVAMSIVEIVKLIAGAVAIAGFLSIKKYKPRTAFLIGLFYFSSAGITCFSCFPCFTSLAFYLPFSLIIGHYFLKGKWYLVPVYSMMVVFYNFYLAYTVFAFMCFAMLVMLVLERKKFFKSLWQLIEYVLFILLGLCMAMSIFLPSMSFILKSTSRDVASGGSLKGLLLLGRGYIEIAISFVSSTGKMILNIFKTPTGLLKNKTFFSDAYLSLRKLYTALSKTRYVGDVKVLSSFFNIEQYYRTLSQTFTPVTPSSFYGYQNSYFLEHVSLYITGVGLLITTYVWFMKGYKANTYKVMMIIIMVMMLLPFFSYILSANLEVLYTRWFNVVTIPLLLIDAYVIDSAGLYDLKPNKMVFSFLILCYFGIFSSYHHLYKISGYAASNNWSEDVTKFENNLFYYVVLALFSVCVFLIALYIIQIRCKKKILKRIFYPATIVLMLSAIGAIAAVLLTSYLKIDTNNWTTEVKESTLFDIEDMMAFQYLIFFTLLMAVVGCYAICAKRKKLLGIIVSIEFLLSAGMSFGSCVILKGRVTTFENSHELGEFLEDNIDEPDTYRIYVDSSISNILTTNTARFLPAGCNSNIFHSFIYAETDDVAGLIYDKSDEGQASKKALNTYSYYLNVFLGYKYVVASPESAFASYDTNQFELVKETNKYILLKFKDYQEFLVYDDYVSTDAFNDKKGSLKDVSRVKLMLNTVIIDEEYLDTLREYFGEETDISSYTDVTSTNTFYQKNAFQNSNSSVVYLTTDDGAKKEGYYYRYAFSGADEITTRSYAINIFGYSDELKVSMVENKEIFLKYAGGGTKFLDSSNIVSKNGSTYHVPVYGLADTNERKPEALYVYAGDTKPSVAPTLRYAAEAIIPKAEYLESYENGEDLPSGAGLEAAMKFHISSAYSDGVIKVTLTKLNTNTSVSYNTIYFEYEDGTIEQATSESSITKTLKNIYIVKSSEAYNLSSPPSVKIMSYEIEGAYSDNYSDKDISYNTKTNSITLSYTNNDVSEGYNIIMIPTAYSEEWTVVSGTVLATFKANGGFIGLVVPKNLSTNTITLKFVPSGLSLGLNVSIAAILFYLEMLFSFILRKKKREVTLCQL